MRLRWTQQSQNMRTASEVEIEKTEAVAAGRSPLFTLLVMILI